MSRERYGNGYLGRAGARRRTRARGRRYGGAPRTAGRARGVAHDWTAGRKVWR
jgi:hypothetical protein